MPYKKKHFSTRKLNININKLKLLIKSKLIYIN